MMNLRKFNSLSSLLVILLATLCFMVSLNCNEIRKVDDEVKETDQNLDGITDTWEYYHGGQNYPYKRAYDRTFNKKIDFYIIISETTGKIASISIDRKTWPVQKNIGLEQWKIKKKKEVIRFWNSPAKGTEIRNTKTGDSIYVEPNDPTRRTALCDICNRKIKRNQGYLLSTKEVLSSDKYINRKGTLAILSGERYLEAKVYFWEHFFKGLAKSPWLICDECIENWMKK